MKKRYILLILPFIILFFCGSEFDYEDTIEKQIESAGESGFSENIPEETKETLDKIGISGIDFESLSALSFEDILILVWESFVDQIKEPFSAIVAITAAGIICAVTECFYDEFSQSKTVINVVSSISAASCILMPMKNLITYSCDVINECSDFMISFIPVYSSAVTAMGYISSATGFRTLMLGVSTVISRLANEIIVPLICIYFALCIAGTVSDLDVGSISKTVKSFAVWVLTLSMTVFSGIMGLGTLITSSADSTVSKTTKFLIGSSIPVVGGTISDAFATVRSCLGVTKNILGVYAIIVIAVIFLPPIISLICWRICLSISSGIGSVLGNKNLSGLLSSASCVMGIMLGLVAVTAVMFIFSVTIMLMMAGG